MALKRKNEQVVGETARERKKQKMDVARTIAVQPVASVAVPENAVAGPSTSAVTDSELNTISSHCIASDKHGTYFVFKA
jgi:hypothetical protein